MANTISIKKSTILKWVWNFNNSFDTDHSARLHADVKLSSNKDLGNHLFEVTSLNNIVLNCTVYKIFIFQYDKSRKYLQR